MGRRKKKARKDDSANISKLNQKIIDFMKTIEFPDMKIIEEVEKTKTMTYEQYKAIDLTSTPDIEKLDSLEAMVKVLKFSQKMDVLSNIIRDHDGPKHPIYQILETMDAPIDELLDDFHQLDGISSDFTDQTESSLKAFIHMKTFPFVFVDLTPESLPKAYIQIFESISSQYLSPITRKLSPKLKTKKYIPPAQAIGIINQKTEQKHQDILSQI